MEDKELLKELKENRKEALAEIIDRYSGYVATVIRDHLGSSCRNVDVEEPEDFLLGNGSMVLLLPEGGEGYGLSAGDTVTISMDASDACIVEFGMFRDGELIERETVKTQEFSQSFTADEDGTYCFTLMYYSASSDHFTDCSVQLHPAE